MSLGGVILTVLAAIGVGVAILFVLELDAIRRASAPECPQCPHPLEAHGALGCRALFCGCERPGWVRE